MILQNECKEFSRFRTVRLKILLINDNFHLSFWVKNHEKLTSSSPNSSSQSES